MGTLQEYLVSAIPKTIVDLEAALYRLPEDKRNWSPMGDARTALDMIAECALLTDVTEIVTTRAFSANFNYEDYKKTKVELAADWARLQPMLHESAAKAVATIKTIPDGDLAIEIAMPWGPFTIAQVIAYPYWNACYHEGQINYIASMLGCLD